MAKKSKVPQVSTTVKSEFTFKDTRGIVWDVRLTLAGATRIDRTDFTELTDIEFTILNPDKAFFTGVLADTRVAFALIFCILEPQIKEQLNIDPVEERELAEMTFMDGIDGMALEGGRVALWKAVADFFPEQKTVLLNLMEHTNRNMKRVQKQLGVMDKQMGEMMDQEVDQRLEEFQRELKTLSSSGGKSSTK